VCTVKREQVDVGLLQNKGLQFVHWSVFVLKSFLIMVKKTT
jgi:hypothetical protein